MHIVWYRMCERKQGKQQALLGHLHYLLHTHIFIQIIHILHPFIKIYGFMSPFYGRPTITVIELNNAVFLLFSIDQRGSNFIFHSTHTETWRTCKTAASSLTGFAFRFWKKCCLNSGCDFQSCNPARVQSSISRAGFIAWICDVGRQLAVIGPSFQQVCL